mgnify:CR=1 FL=1
MTWRPCGGPPAWAGGLSGLPPVSPPAVSAPLRAPPSVALPGPLSGATARAGPPPLSTFDAAGLSLLAPQPASSRTPALATAASKTVVRFMHI